MNDTHDGRCKTCGGFYGDHGLCVTPGCPGDATPPDTCDYCHYTLDPTDRYAFTAADGSTLNIARCPQCSAIHRLVNTAAFFSNSCHTTDCPGRTIDRDEYHPTEDNTPWGFPLCRHCSSPDPFTNLLGFVSTVVQRNLQQSDAITRTQNANSSLVRRNRELSDANSRVHAEMAEVLQAISRRVCALDPMTPGEAVVRLTTLPPLEVLPAEMAVEYAEHVSVTQRYHGDIHIGPGVFSTVQAAVHSTFLDGMAAGIRWEGERRAALDKQ